MLKIEPLQEAFVPAAAAIERECLSTAWTEEQLRSLGENTRYWVALLDGQAVGILSVSLSLFDGEVLNLAVLPSARKRGVAQALLDEMKAQLPHSCEELFLEVAESNLPAIRLYEKNGFLPVGRRKNFYGNEDALLLKVSLC